MDIFGHFRQSGIFCQESSLLARLKENETLPAGIDGIVRQDDLF
jgi:hypothetical protein